MNVLAKLFSKAAYGQNECSPWENPPTVPGGQLKRQNTCLLAVPVHKELFKQTESYLHRHQKNPTF